MDAERTEINTIYPLSELLKYKEHIEALAVGDNNELVYNDSAVHASLIMGCMLRHSNQISMYCGKFSIFRDNFKAKIEKMFESSIYDEERNKSSLGHFTPYEDAVSSLISFFVRGGRMTVVLEESLENFKNENLYQRISTYLTNGQLIFFKRRDGAGKLYHFAIGDGQRYRWENDKYERTALCSFYDKNTVALLNDSFEIIKQQSEPINLEQ